MEIRLNQPYSFCQFGRRDNQEDSRFPDADMPVGYAPFFLVCDGVGGCEKGEVASSTVCSAFAQALESFDWTQDFTNEDFMHALDNAYNALAKISNKQNSDMATTLTFAAFHAGGCTVAHIGDSRVYHVRPHEGVLYRSDDHSLVNAMVHSGNLTPEEALHHPDSNIITRYIGVVKKGQERSSATIMRLTDLAAGDYLFLCSDGVLHEMSDEKLLAILSQDKPDNEKIAEIAALSAGSDDNNTAYLIPIAEVADDDSGMDADEMAATGDTQPLSRRQEQARDMKSESSASVGGKVREFFKNMF